MKGPEKFLIAGEWRTSDEISNIHFPYTDEVIGSVYRATIRDVHDAVRKAREAFNLTKKLTTGMRYEILVKLADLIEKNREILREVLILEGGKTWNVANTEVTRSIDTIRVSAEEATRLGGEIILLDRVQSGVNHTGFLLRVPIGIVLAISPFNYPLNLPCHKIGPAVASGNPIILKPSSVTPLSALILGSLLLEAGYPPEGVSVIPCSTDIALSLVKDPDIDLLSFTGSPDTGWYLHSVAGRKRVSLELGGNAGVIVHSDTRIKDCAEKIVAAGFSNAGQSCISVQRVFVEKDVYNEFLEHLLAKTKLLTTGDPRKPITDIGPLINEDAVLLVMEKVNEALREGASLLTGGERDGCLVFPTILTGTKPHMRVNSEEIFGPVITVEPYDSFEEAIDRLNNSKFGLQAGVFTQDIRRANMAAASINAGCILINEVPTYRIDSMPYGGVKCSGTGREGPKYAIQEMTEYKLLILNQE